MPQPSSLPRDRRAGVFVFLLIFLLQYTSTTYLSGVFASPSAGGQGQYDWGRLHVLPAILAYTALAFAAVYAMLYLIGQRNFKHHHFGLLFDRLPPLELLGRMSFQALLGGFVFMTVTIITGAVLLGGSGSDRPAAQIDPKLTAKIVIGSIGWVTCAAAVVGKYALKWSTSRISGIALAGFLVVVALFVTSLALS